MLIDVNCPADEDLSGVISKEHLDQYTEAVNWSDSRAIQKLLAASQTTIKENEDLPCLVMDQEESDMRKNVLYHTQEHQSLPVKSSKNQYDRFSSVITEIDIVRD